MDEVKVLQNNEIVDAYEPRLIEVVSDVAATVKATKESKPKRVSNAVKAHEITLDSAMTYDKLPKTVLQTSFTDNLSTEHYKQINTYEIMDKLNGFGWTPTSIKLGGVRNSANNGFQKHLVRFAYKSDLVNDSEGRPEIVLINSHNGSSSLRICMGYFRFVCMNGLIVGDQLANFKQKHIGDVQTNLSEYLDYVKDVEAAKLIEVKNKMIEIELTDAQKQEFVTSYMKAAYGDNFNNIEDPMVIAKPKRDSDNKNTLWNFVNNIQENVMKGGVITKSKKTTRKVGSVNNEIKFNFLLWNIASNYMQ